MDHQRCKADSLAIRLLTMGPKPKMDTGILIEIGGPISLGGETL